MAAKLRKLRKQCYRHLIAHSPFLIIPALVLIYLSIKKYLDDFHNTNNLAVIGASSLSLCTVLAAYIICFLIRPASTKIYLVDFACYKHDPAFLTNRETIVDKMSALLSPDSLAFSTKVMDRSGVSDQAFVYGFQDFPPKSAFACAREEAELVICGAVDDLLARTRVERRRIGVVIVNISTFNPVPSLSAMIVNRYKLSGDVLTYNLGGMGCSAGLIAVDLAKRLLQVRSNSYALIMSVESPTSGYYLGDDKSKLLSNCLFRMGGAAVLLSNLPSDRRVSKYELRHSLRTHRGADDRAYSCVLQEPDAQGRLGMTISRDLMSVAGEALKANITTLAPLVLPFSEQFLYLATLIAGKYVKVKRHVPDLKAAFEHFCIHAGGKAVLDEVEKSLKLTRWDMEPSRMTLYRYSNTSSSSVWYQLAYAEAKGRVRTGDRVWQIGFGSGFKCASVVWRALRTIRPDHLDNPWVDVIHHFPVHNIS